MKEFKFLTHDVVDPEFNIASEEYLLKNTKGYYVYLWQNSPSVIVGVNQNVFEEVNLDYTQKNGIKVVRRITGGGAVYHDLNNICYTVIAPFDNQKQNYKEFTAPLIDFLKGLGVNAELSGRNDVTVGGKKISGNAQTVFGDRILQHGTLLFKTDMDALTSALKPNKLKMQSKGIKSVRARVTNIYDELPVKTTCQEFFDLLKAHLSKGLEKYTFSEQDLKEIQKLKDEKYSSFDWNAGRSPKGKNTFEGRFDFGTLNINFDTLNGKMINVVITGDFFSKKPIQEFCQKLELVPFEKARVQKVFYDVCSYIDGADANQIVDKLFE